MIVVDRSRSSRTRSRSASPSQKLKLVDYWQWSLSVNLIIMVTIIAMPLNVADALCEVYKCSYRTISQLTGCRQRWHIEPCSTFRCKQSCQTWRTTQSLCNKFIRPAFKLLIQLAAVLMISSTDKFCMHRIGSNSHTVDDCQHFGIACRTIRVISVVCSCILQASGRCVKMCVHAVVERMHHLLWLCTSHSLACACIDTGHLV